MKCICERWLWLVSTVVFIVLGLVMDQPMAFMCASAMMLNYAIRSP